MTREKLKEIVEAIRKQTPRGWILMSPNSIGEVLITCAFARSLIVTTGYPVTLCVRPEHAALVETLYPNRFSAVLQLGQEVMRAFSTSGLIPPDFFDIDFPINLSPMQHGGNDRLLQFHSLIYKRGGRSGMTLTDVWRHMLHLDWDAPMETPCMDYFMQDKPFLDQLGVAGADYTLFQIGNNTNKPLPASFWASMEQMALERNLKVLVNLNGSMLVEKGLNFERAQICRLGILEALYVSYRSSSVVGGNNGLALSTAFLEYDENAPVVNVITTNMYCKHYHLLAQEWENAFVPYDGIPSIAAGAPELISTSARVNEWHVATGLSDDTYHHVANDIANENRDSEFFFSLPPCTGDSPIPHTVSFVKL
ncbi:MAG TPA: hypothetical protein VM553_08860 [Dongiaceae bacterium]|nr:hypothetical protein [Dongiaceae bacterium]